MNQISIVSRQKKNFIIMVTLSITMSCFMITACDQAKEEQAQSSISPIGRAVQSALQENTNATPALASAPAAAPNVTTDVPAVPSSHDETLPTPATESSISVQKIENGYTVAELYARKAELNGKPVKIRGQVVKYLAGIMGKNWIHLRDGSGSEGTNDLTISTLETVQKGNIIVINGKLIMDKDLGQGYRYPIFMEDVVAIVIEK